MTNSFKTLLLKIARLKTSDQQWLLAQLTPTQKEQFNKKKGEEWLKSARRFRKLPLDKLPTIEPQEVLPNFCQELNNQSALFIAIVLEQGQFNWQEQFLASSLKKNQIQQLTESVLAQLKPATKLCLFKEWQKQWPFSDHLESHHG